MGTPHYAKEILEALIQAEDMEVSLVLTQPDRPVGRKKILTAPPVKDLALEHGIKVLQAERLSDEGIKEAISAVKPDFIIVAAFGQLLPKSILDIVPCINLHASLLPLYRGASPIQQSLLNGDTYTGVTSMLMEEGLDSGPMLGHYYFKIPKDMKLQALMVKLAKDASILTLDTIRHFDKLKPQEQTKASATYCKKIKKSEGEVAFISAETLYNKYRAFEGWPGIFMANGTKLLELELLETTNTHKEGEILSYEGETVVLGCLCGALRIASLQPPSKKPMTAKAFCVGRGLKVGDTIL